jgi:hypothetical protein
MSSEQHKATALRCSHDNMSPKAGRCLGKLSPVICRGKLLQKCPTGSQSNEVCPMIPQNRGFYLTSAAPAKSPQAKLFILLLTFLSTFGFFLTKMDVHIIKFFMFEGFFDRSLIFYEEYSIFASSLLIYIFLIK